MLGNFSKCTPYGWYNLNPHKKYNDTWDARHCPDTRNARTRNLFDDDILNVNVIKKAHARPGLFLRGHPIQNVEVEFLYLGKKMLAPLAKSQW